jgi:hypothetical protein
MASVCRFCQRPLQGGIECVSCYRARLVRCPERARTRLRCRKDPCPKCHNEGWLLLPEPRPAEVLEP